WVVLHGAPLVSTGDKPVAVIIEPAHPARIFPLLRRRTGSPSGSATSPGWSAHGGSTAQIAEELVLSAHTVQQHLKAVFDKTGVRSRRDLVAKVFFTHYEPRFRDNENRVAQDRPMRGGPVRCS
ncbi:MAG: helix-turn-helix transcriptional regulator, partial [Pseudonocardia sp.]|nr:helix-turn-helix transcriptional regulator [Pseudonocardia sp.]